MTTDTTPAQAHNPDLRVLAAGYLMPEGYGSTILGRRTWLNTEGKPTPRLDPMDLSWSSLFTVPSPRFGRMSPLTRLGLMAVELLGVDFAGMTDAQRTETGLCLVSPLGSIATDIEFIREPGPGAFTYTLPSSVIGEVCIRHKLRGPCLCLMSAGTAGRGPIEEAVERIAMGEARGMLCLLCEAAGTGAPLLNYALDPQPDFCWYAYALYLERQEGAGKAGYPLPADTPPCGIDIRQLCLDLCGKL